MCKSFFFFELEIFEPIFEAESIEICNISLGLKCCDCLSLVKVSASTFERQKENGTSQSFKQNPNVPISNRLIFQTYIQKAISLVKINKFRFLAKRINFTCSGILFIF